MRPSARLGLVVLVAASTLVAARDLTGARPAFAQAGGSPPAAPPKATPYFSPRQIAILSAVAPPKKKGDSALDGKLAETAEHALQNRFSAPDYRRVDAALVRAALVGLASANGKPINELPTDDVVRSLKIVGEATHADRVVYALVTQASGKDVAVTLWLVDRKTGTATVDGKTMHRLWTDILAVSKDPNSRTPSVGIKFNSSLDSDKQKVMIDQMIQEWGSTVTRN